MSGGQWFAAASSLVGQLCLLLLCAAILVAACSYAYGTYQHWWEKRLRAAVDIDLRRLGSNLRANHYWFSGHPERQAIWIAVSETIAAGGWPDVQRVRDQDFPRIIKDLLEGRNP